MQLKRCCIREPCQCGRVLNQDVLDIRSAGTPGNGIGFDLFRGEARRILFPKRLSRHPVRVSFQSYRSILEVRQNEWRDSGVVVNDVGLRSSRLRIEDFAQPGALDLVPFDFEDNLIVPAQLGWRSVMTWSLLARHTSIFVASSSRRARGGFRTSSLSLGRVLGKQ
jgi:hypothetical protein